MGTKTSNLYRITSDGQDFYVEAPFFTEAIEAWQKYVGSLPAGDGWTGTEQPDEVCLIRSDHEVIRWPYYPPAPAASPEPTYAPSSVPCPVCGATTACDHMPC